MADNPAEIPELPPEQAIDRLVSLLEPYQRITQPKFSGIGNLPDDGSLLVGNHTIYGFLDLPFMMAEVWKRRRIVVRGLGEHAHYKVPVWRDLLAACGMVRGTRDNVRALMRDHQTILVYPGGAREVNKRRGQQYQLLWGERMGFARLAIEQGYPIVPCAAVGADDMFDVIVDQSTPLYGQLALAYEKVMGFPTPPVVQGVGLTGIPRPERLYFWFGEPIDTTGFAGQDDDTAARGVRDDVKQSVMAGIQLLREERDKDPDRDLTKRLLRSANLGTRNVEKSKADHPAEIPQLPPEQAIDRLVSLLEPYRRITQPKFHGIGNLPDDGSLLVGNHTTYGFLDLPLMLAEVWKRRRIVVRGLGEDAHYKVPVWRDLLGASGMVRGTRDNVRALMRDHQTILVFPGGSREVYKRRGQQYQLLWGERLGFARLAIEQGYPIVPCAAVGVEDMLDVILDVDTPLYGQLARLSKKLTGLPVPPVVRGVGPKGIPRPERLYFWFGEPIDTTGFAGQDDDTAARAVRDEVKQSVMAGLQFLRDERDKDPDRDLATRLLRRPE
jgi:1-acyl-sn-glycerol-3-phosphate acyltransferase